jgi:quercetin dioxygenase-like cupin family protein
VSAAAAPSTTEPPIPPIAVEELTRIDADTLVRGSVMDTVTANFTISREGMEDVVIDITDLSQVAVARFTIQPGVQFPWHTHPGPVLVTVTHGELVYVMAEGCSEHVYPAGTAFVDPGRGMVHTAYNATEGETPG